MRTETIETLAQLSANSYSLSMNDLFTVAPERLINNLCFYSTKLSGDYVIVGKATITVEISDREDLVGKAIETLDEKIKKEIADSHIRVSLMKEQIRNLLALPNYSEESCPTT